MHDEYAQLIVHGRVDRWVAVDKIDSQDAVLQKDIESVSGASTFSVALET